MEDKKIDEHLKDKYLLVGYQRALILLTAAYQSLLREASFQVTERTIQKAFNSLKLSSHEDILKEYVEARKIVQFTEVTIDSSNEIDKDYQHKLQTLIYERALFWLAFGWQDVTGVSAEKTAAEAVNEGFLVMKEFSKEEIEEKFKKSYEMFSSVLEIFNAASEPN